MKRIGLLLILTLYSCLSVFAQLNEGGQPYSFGLINDFVWNIEARQTTLDLSDLSLKSARLASDVKLKSFRYGESVDFELDLIEDGKLILDDGKRKVWLARVISKEAKSLGVVFNDFHLTGTSRVFLYSGDLMWVKGAYTQKNNKRAGVLAIEPIVGDECFIELEVPYSELETTRLKVGSLIHDYTGIVGTGRRPLGMSGGCNVSAGCQESASFLNEKNAVVRILSKGELCTGVLLNNKRNDATPYMLTAYHCIEDEQHASSSVFYFNYESPICGLVDGDPTHTLSGADLKVGIENVDVALCQLSVDVPASFRPYFAGWTRDDVSGGTFCWHHPIGDNKKISRDNDQPMIASYGENFVPNNFLRIARWDYGTTEVGSSGAPLFNMNGEVVGSLTGGDANCNTPVNDFFSSLARNFTLVDSERSQSIAGLLAGNNSSRNCEGFNPFLSAGCSELNKWSLGDDFFAEPINEESNYYAGKNDNGWDEVLEYFPNNNLLSIYEISLGISVNESDVDDYLMLKIYDANDKTVYSQRVVLSQLATNAMNFVYLDSPIEVLGDFSVGISWPSSGIEAFSLMHTLIDDMSVPGFAVRRPDGVLESIADASNMMLNGNLAIEVHACGFNQFVAGKVQFYFNVSTKTTTVEVPNSELKSAHFIDLSGRKYPAMYKKIGEERYNVFGLERYSEGVYIVQVVTAHGTYSHKIINKH